LSRRSDSWALATVGRLGRNPAIGWAIPSVYLPAAVSTDPAAV
jgi:hypothetical protein